MRKLTLIFLLMFFFIAGCATAPQSRPEQTSLPTLEKGWGRIYIGGGSLCSGMCVKLWSEGQVGPVFINGQRVWTFAKNEHTAIDLLPGIYEVYWVPNKPDKVFSQKSAITISAGSNRYFATDSETRIGAHFGLIGALASDYTMNAVINEKQNLDVESKLVSYLKFNKQETSGQPNQKLPAALKPPAGMSLDASQIKCAELGFKPATEAYGQCVLQLSK